MKCRLAYPNNLFQGYSPSEVKARAQVHRHLSLSALSSIVMDLTKEPKDQGPFGRNPLP